MPIKEHRAARTALMEIRGMGHLHTADLQMRRLAVALEAILDDLEYLRARVDALSGGPGEENQLSESNPDPDTGTD